MKKIVSITALLLVVLTLSACTEQIKCGAGTEFKDGACVAPETPDVIYNPDDTDPEDKEPTDQEPVDQEPVDNTPSNALELHANLDFTDSDITTWVPEGNVVLSHDEAGYLVANVSAFTGDFYQDNFTIGNLGTQEDFTYTVTFTAKTDIETGRNVQFFLEDTDNNYLKYIIETETLSTEFQTFTYTYIATANNNDTKLGVFVGNMDNAELGNVIIDEITVTKEAGLQGTLFEDLVNPNFDDSDISNWNTEGNVALSYDEAGYLVMDVTAFTGNFWEENVTYGNLITESWTNYTVEVVIKGTVERDVILFVEDTDAGFIKYAEITHTVTTDWTTITLTFKPLESNADTKIGLFLGDMENAGFGQIMIDSITITADPTF